jgi:hypothetical protein
MPQATQRRINEVIDLTGEESPRATSNLGYPPTARLGDAARGPRFANNIIDLATDSPTDPPPQPRPSADVQVLSSRTLHFPRTRTLLNLPESREAFNLDIFNPDVPPYLPPEAQALVDGRTDTFGFRPLREMSRGSGVIGPNYGVEDVLLAISERHRMGSSIVVSTTRHYGLADRNDSIPGSIPASNLGGFEIVDDQSGTDDGSHTDASYRAPPTPPPGFTRTPRSGDELVCPNCDAELCTGDDDIARQVWAVKACGHVSFLAVVVLR